MDYSKESIGLIGKVFTMYDMYYYNVYRQRPKQEGILKAIGLSNETVNTLCKNNRQIPRNFYMYDITAPGMRSQSINYRLFYINIMKLLCDERNAKCIEDGFNHEQGWKKSDEEPYEYFTRSDDKNMGIAPIPYEENEIKKLIEGLDGVNDTQQRIALYMCYRLYMGVNKKCPPIYMLKNRLQLLNIGDALQEYNQLKEQYSEITPRIFPRIKQMADREHPNLIAAYAVADAYYYGNSGVEENFKESYERYKKIVDRCYNDQNCYEAVFSDLLSIEEELIYPLANWSLSFILFTKYDKLKNLHNGVFISREKAYDIAARLLYVCILKESPYLSKSTYLGHIYNRLGKLFLHKNIDYDGFKIEDIYLTAKYVAYTGELPNNSVSNEDQTEKINVAARNYLKKSDLYPEQYRDAYVMFKKSIDINPTTHYARNNILFLLNELVFEALDSRDDYVKLYVDSLEKTAQEKTNSWALKTLGEYYSNPVLYKRYHVDGPKSSTVTYHASDVPKEPDKALQCFKDAVDNCNYGDPDAGACALFIVRDFSDKIDTLYLDKCKDIIEHSNNAWAKEELIKLSI